jgi:hypothetical protein
MAVAPVQITHFLALDIRPANDCLVDEGIAAVATTATEERFLTRIIDTLQDFARKLDAALTLPAHAFEYHLAVLLIHNRIQVLIKPACKFRLADFLDALQTANTKSIEIIHQQNPIDGGM